MSITVDLHKVFTGAHGLSLSYNCIQLVYSCDSRVILIHRNNQFASFSKWLLPARRVHTPSRPSSRLHLGCFDPWCNGFVSGPFGKWDPCTRWARPEWCDLRVSCRRRDEFCGPQTPGSMGVLFVMPCRRTGSSAALGMKPDCSKLKGSWRSWQSSQTSRYGPPLEDTTKM